jgi:hypothetical protein
MIGRVLDWPEPSSLLRYIRAASGRGGANPLALGGFPR